MSFIIAALYERKMKSRTSSLQAADTLLSIDKQFFIWSVVSSDPAEFSIIYNFAWTLLRDRDSAVFWFRLFYCNLKRSSFVRNRMLHYVTVGCVCARRGARSLSHFQDET